MQTRKKRLIIERMRSVKWTWLALLLLVILSLAHAEITIVDKDHVMMTTTDYKIFIEDSEELRILKENGVDRQSASTQNYRIYIGGNMGTYGIGVNGGVIF